MWSRAAGLSDAELTHFTIEQDLVQVRSGSVSYGTIILGKIRIPAVNDELGKGYLYVRCVDHVGVPDRRQYTHQRWSGICFGAYICHVRKVMT